MNPYGRNISLAAVRPSTSGMTLVETMISLVISIFLVVVVMRSFLPLVSGEHQAQAINHNREILRSFETAITEKLLFKKQTVSGYLADRNLIMFSMVDSLGAPYNTMRCKPEFFKSRVPGSSPPRHYTLFAGTFGSGKFSSRYYYSDSPADYQKLTGNDVPKSLNDARSRCRSYGGPLSSIGDQTTSLNFCVKIDSNMPSRPNDPNFAADQEEFKKISRQIFSSQYNIFSEVHVDLVDLRTGSPLTCKNFGTTENAGAHLFYTMYWHKEKYRQGERFFSRKSGYFLGAPNSN